MINILNLFIDETGEVDDEIINIITKILKKICKKKIFPPFGVFYDSNLDFPIVNRNFLKSMVVKKVNNIAGDNLKPKQIKHCMRINSGNFYVVTSNMDVNYFILIDLDYVNVENEKLELERRLIELEEQISSLEDEISDINEELTEGNISKSYNDRKSLRSRIIYIEDKFNINNESSNFRGSY